MTTNLNVVNVSFQVVSTSTQELMSGDPSSPTLGLKVTLFPSILNLRTSLTPKEPIKRANQRTAMSMDALLYLSTRNAVAIERNSKNNSTRKKLT